MHERKTGRKKGSEKFGRIGALYVTHVGRRVCGHDKGAGKERSDLPQPDVSRSEDMKGCNATLLAKSLCLILCETEPELVLEYMCNVFGMDKVSGS